MLSCSANKILKHAAHQQGLHILKTSLHWYGLELLSLGPPAVKNWLGKVGKEINDLIHKPGKSLSSEKCNSGKGFENNTWEDKSIFENKKKKFASISRLLSEKSVKNKLKCHLQIG